MCDIKIENEAILDDKKDNVATSVVQNEPQEPIIE